MAADREEPALSVAGLVKTYSPSVTIGPLSFEVRTGEHLSLLGPSGCGKTTTLRCIAGFESLSAGTIHLGGVRLDEQPAHKRGVGLVFQNYALFPHLSVFENIAFGLRLARRERPEIERRVQAMLELVGLGEVAARLPSQLSGGQQQRVAIARAVVMEPRLILFDEPLSNLDLKLRVQMRRELRELQRRLGKTTIYVTHDQTEALALSDRIAVLSAGRIEQIGTPREIYERPATTFVADFIGTANLVHGEVASLSGTRLTVTTREGLHFVSEADDVAHSGRVLLMLRPERIQLNAEAGTVEGAENRYEARITDITYLGEDLSLSLLLGAGLELVATAKTSFRTKALAVGQSVVVSAAAADVHVLKA
ncbi:MAG: ABC transporter ATP-binding protein [Alphaproteobacteria bacterium]